MTIDNNSDENNANRNKSSGVYANANSMNSNAMPYVQIESEVPLLPFPRMTPPVSLLNAATNLMPNANNGLHYGTENLDADWFFTEVEIKIKMPEELKERLADDWEAINEQSKLLNIPSRITAQDVVDQYVASKTSRKSVCPANAAIVTEVMTSVVQYFNGMLYANLLYNSEKRQYFEILQKHPNIPFSQLYGAFHLLRVFMNLNSVFILSGADENHKQTVIKYLQDFLKFLVRNKTIYFRMSNFIKASPQYANAAIVAEVMTGVIEYFNGMLGANLLYDSERRQYIEVLQKHPNIPVSQLYGAFHLLRLFKNLNSVITLSVADAEHMQTILKYLQDFLKFVVRNKTIYFRMSNFIKARPQYEFLL
uniref:MRG domain-containing protein n=1 Tax=Glossina brevipalpis TaxID=37001 RepID=A0A1A9WDZ1_9MUSC